MPYEEVVYKRDELYEKVWSKPVRKVATEYGCSDVALAKMCRRLGVPLPGRGYWARVTAGQKLKRLRLPPLKKDQSSEIHVRRWKGPAERTMTDEVKERLAKEREAEAPVVVPDALPAEPHELVALTLKVLGKQKPKPGPLLDRGDRRCLSVSVAPSSLDRALRIFEALLSALDARGLTVEATKPAPARLDRHGRLEQSAVAGMTRVSKGLIRLPWPDQEEGIKKVSAVRNTLLHGNYEQAARDAGCASPAEYFQKQFAGEVESMFKITDGIVKQIDPDTGRPHSKS